MGQTILQGKSRRLLVFVTLMDVASDGHGQKGSIPVDGERNVVTMGSSSRYVIPTPLSTGTKR